MIEQEKFDILIEKVKERFPFQYWKFSSYDWFDYIERTNKHRSIYCKPNNIYDLVVDNKLFAIEFSDFLDICMGKIFNDIYKKYKKVGKENICIKENKKKVDFEREDGGDWYTIELDKLPKKIWFNLLDDYITLEIMINDVKYCVKKTIHWYHDTDGWPSNIMKDKSKYSFCGPYNSNAEGISISCSPFEKADDKIIQEMQDIVLEGYKKMYNYAVNKWCKKMLEATKKSPIEMLEIIEILDKLYEIEGNKKTRALEVLMLNMKKNPNIPINEIEKFFYKIKAANHYIEYSPEENK